MPDTLLPRKPRRAPWPALALAALIGVVLVAPPAWAEDPLEQTVRPDEPVRTDRVVLDRGHVDIGPRFVDGRWTMLLRDDAQVPSVWRSLDSTVLQVPDGPGQLTVPDDPAYSFLGQPAGTSVYVVPQTQNPDVVWAGWNTQDPEVVQRVERGATLRLLGVEGPGDLVVFLQDGGISAPDVLWDSRTKDTQGIWMDANVHTHANWVFSTAGVYLVRTELTAKLRDGTTVSSKETLRFAVGSTADLEEAATRAWPGAAVAPTAGTVVPAPPDAQTQPTRTLSSPVLLALGAAVLVLVGLVLLVAHSVVLRGRERSRALAETAPDPRPGSYAGDKDPR